LKRRGKASFLTALVLVCIAYFAVMQIPVVIKMIYPLYFKETIIKYSEEYKLPPPMVAAVIKTESGFDVFAESSKSARGLMQITPSTGKWIAEKVQMKSYNDDMLYDPEVNIKFGCWYIRYLYASYNNDMNLTFAAYNGGRGNVDKWLQNEKLSKDGKNLDQIPFEETKNFVNRVNNNYKIYKKLYQWN
jgi:soluble lytic murein transglycosylase